MRKSEKIIKKSITIRTLVHSGTGALIAVSDDLRGFMVAGVTSDEIAGKLEGALRDHFEMMGNIVISVTIEPETGDVSGFNREMPAFIANTCLSDKHAT
jgi:hypothetical protein